MPACCSKSQIQGSRIETHKIGQRCDVLWRDVPSTVKQSNAFDRRSIAASNYTHLNRVHVRKWDTVVDLSSPCNCDRFLRFERKTGNCTTLVSLGHHLEIGMTKCKTKNTTLARFSVQRRLNVLDMFCAWWHRYGQPIQPTGKRRKQYGLIFVQFYCFIIFVNTIRRLEIFQCENDTRDRIWEVSTQPLMKRKITFVTQCKNSKY